LKLFIDTANLEEIREINSWGVVDGVTTNPSLIAKNGGIVKEVYKEILSIVQGPVSLEVNSDDYKSMIEEARDLSKLGKNVVIKIPITEEGLKACSILSKEKIRVNITLVFSASQALLAARSGASFVSPFVGRLDDIGQDGISLIRDIATIFKEHQITTLIIAASIRSVDHVKKAALVGADISTVPYKIFKEMIVHDLTDKGITKFKEDYNKVYKKGE
jgi:hypothetical protein